MIPASLLNHLWQSTFFAAAAWLLALALRENRAHVRFWLWFAASCKFLVPFSVLVTIGSQFEWRAPGDLPLPLSVVMDQISQPFASLAPDLLATAPRAVSWSPAVLFYLWLCGFLAVAFAWALSMGRIKEVLRLKHELGLGSARLPEAVRSISPPLRIATARRTSWVWMAAHQRMG
jgi:hypothetical protein